MRRMNRRTFIGTSLAAACVAARPSWAAGPIHRIERIGLQLYTVREAMKRDFEDTLAKVATIGYREVEFAGYFDHDPKLVRSILDARGLVAPSAHVDYEVLERKWPETLEVAHLIGHSFLVCPWIDESRRDKPDGWKRAADQFNHAGEASKKAGIQFAYHNHTFEFQPNDSLGGKLPYDFLLANTDPNLVKMQMDLCWISAAGKDPLDYFDKYPGRFPLVHVKDLARDGKTWSTYKGSTGAPVKYEGAMADVGSGIIDWRRIFAKSDKAGIQHYFVENDNPKSAFDSIETSYNYLAKLQF